MDEVSPVPRDVSGDGVEGLRGRISIALALPLPLGEHKDPLITATSIVVLFSVLVQGATIGHVIKQT